MVEILVKSESVSQNFKNNENGLAKLRFNTT